MYRQSRCVRLKRKVEGLVVEAASVGKDDFIGRGGFGGCIRAPQWNAGDPEQDQEAEPFLVPMHEGLKSKV